MNAIEIGQVASKVNLSQATIYRMIVEGAFPRPFPFGVGGTAWSEGDIDAWLQARKDEQPAPAPTRASRADHGNAIEAVSPVIDQSISVDAIAERLFAQFEARMQRTVPFEHALWSTKEIGE
ncbi:helix-turn-helix transcriptional regulator [Trinickia acidisoli]|uniref:helix-turn-helix transcriptional regulator n=1 Tax=Trinickia acidisoli TaxID=2767482 RepID=UPI001A8FB586|nr:AlpA family phage regulatory protein [Trinickia acidisoli]